MKAEQRRESGGCWACGVNTPVVELELREGVAWVARERGKEGVKSSPWTRPYALCLPCLACWFPGRRHEWVEAWLVRQVDLGKAWERDKRLAAWLAGVGA